MAKFIDGQRPTIRQIAKRAKVSEATVCRALNDHPHQSQTTKDRIKRIAEEIGYIKHPFVSALMTEVRNRRSVNHSPVIALVHCLPKEWFPIPNLSDLKEGAQQVASEQGYTVEEFFLKEDGMTPKRLISIVEARGIKGMIFEHMIQPDLTSQIDLRQFACVTIEYLVHAPEFHKINTDQFGGMQIALKKAVEYGYRRIGFISNTNREKLNAYRRKAAMLLSENMADEDVFFTSHETDFGKVGYEHEAAKWIRENRLDAIMSMRAKMPEELKQAGVQIPEDLGFIHLDLSKENPHNHSGIDPNWQRVGNTAVKQVVGMLRRNEHGTQDEPLLTYVPAHWVDGQSLPKRDQS